MSIQRGASEFQVGDMTIQRIIENPSMCVPVNFMFTNVTEDAISEARTRLTADHYQRHGDLAVMVVQSYVIRIGDRTILVDSCVGNEKERPHIPDMHQLQTDYLDRLAAAGVRPEDVDMVLCTHLHPDHVGWNTRLSDGQWVPTFPNAGYLVGREEFEAAKKFREMDPPDDLAADLQTMLDDSVFPIESAGLLTLVESDEELVRELDHGLRLEAAPGHSIAQCIVHLEAGGARGILCADVMHHPIQLIDPEIGHFGDFDHAQAVETRRHLIEAYADTDTIFSPAHFAGVNAGRFVSSAAGFDFAWLGLEP